MKGSLMKQYQMIYSYMMKNDVQVRRLSLLNSLTSTTSQIRTLWCMRRDWVIPCLLYPFRLLSAFPSPNLVFSPYLKIGDVTRTKKTVAEWLFKKKDLMIQPQQCYW